MKDVWQPPSTGYSIFQNSTRNSGIHSHNATEGTRLEKAAYDNNLGGERLTRIQEGMKEILKTSGPDKKPFFLPPSSRCSTPSRDPYHSSHSVTAALAGPLQPAGPGCTWTATAGTTDSLPISIYSRRADCVSDRSAALTLLLAHGRLVGMHIFRAAGWPVWGLSCLVFSGGSPKSNDRKLGKVSC